MNGTGASGDAVLAIGGYTSSYVGIVESWNGTSWTEIADLNTVRGYIAATGTTAAALAVAGEPTPRALVESWNGTSWTETTDINTARGQGASFGPSTDAATFGGESPPGYNNNTEIWDGSTWTEVANLSLARNALGGRGTTSAGIAIGSGVNPTVANEEWTVGQNIKVITD